MVRIHPVPPMNRIQRRQLARDMRKYQTIVNNLEWAYGHLQPTGKLEKKAKRFEKRLLHILNDPIV